ncbi:ATP12 family chaperone protein [Oleisolibacter albus]|uniref:ATP12 family chaperone protein n=1 Tax=Oleisolibacter albus TaxID=2171757 RepID=UPI000DF41349|nr:ATP12 family protein [Oleisolibacter albus]
MKRFYKTVSVVPAGAAFAVHLDGRPVRTPAKAPLDLPTRALADAIAAEWEAQGEELVPQTMPMTQLASTALDGVHLRREAVADAAAAYAGTDLLCYRAEHPQELAERQAALWQPLLDWAAVRFDAVLVPTAGILHRPQDPDALARLRQALDAYDPWRLTALQNAVGICGSLIVALALLDGRISAAEAFAIAQLDETFQIEQWGEDAEATRRRTAQREDLEATACFLALLGK